MGSVPSLRANRPVRIRFKRDRSSFFKDTVGLVLTASQGRVDTLGRRNGRAGPRAPLAISDHPGSPQREARVNERTATLIKLFRDLSAIEYGLIAAVLAVSAVAIVSN